MTSSLVLEVFRARLLSVHQPVSSSTSARYADSSPSEMSILRLKQKYKKQKAFIYSQKSNQTPNVAFRRSMVSLEENATGKHIVESTDMSHIVKNTVQCECQSLRSPNPLRPFPDTLLSSPFFNLYIEPTSWTRTCYYSVQWSLTAEGSLVEPKRLGYHYLLRDNYYVMCCCNDVFFCVS